MLHPTSVSHISHHEAQLLPCPLSRIGLHRRHPQKTRKGHRAFMGFHLRPPLVRRTLTDHSFNLTSPSSFSVEFHRKVSQSSATQNDRDGTGLILRELECSMKGLMRMMKVESCWCCEGVWLGVLGQWWLMIKGDGGF
ncbi:hypothetical protein V6N11_011205 [Hibiscus sabdariffa]|uniref:Uncharacterized protein n=1 Tax=Hibiscus sabdariffa TaxID=183260 RepID=A0ABR2S894_9ROSI